MTTYLPGTDPTLIRPGLSRCLALLERLDRPQTRLHYIHVTGTNGKGSTCACIASILRCAGLRVGLFTSPALEHFAERVQVDGVPIPAETLAALDGEVKAAVAGMEDPPTEFEQATALALLHFARSGCDLVVLEVGLGGGEDATNVIPPPEVAVFTAMGLDHTGILGSSLEAIATAKAGILKPGCIAVSYGNQPSCNRVFAERCAALGIPLVPVDFNRLGAVAADLRGSRFTLAPYGAMTLPLLGEYQLRNALTAVTVVEQLRSRGWHIPTAAIAEGLAEVRWPGRLELLQEGPTFLLDGSHNPQGLQATVESLTRLLPQRPVILMGVMADKDVETMLGLLLPVAEGFVTVTPDNPRALSAERLAERIRAAGGTATTCSTIAEGVRTAEHLAGQEGAVCALGTLYFSAEVRAALKKPCEYR